MVSDSQENRILLALEALERDPKLSIRRAAITYKVSRTTLAQRRQGRSSRGGLPANSRKLTDYEEQVVVQYILDQDAEGFPPRPVDVREMANILLAERNAEAVGVNWTTGFIKRHPELTARFSRRYDYVRAQCEDPDLIRGWFKLVKNTIAKYGIVEDDIYNFDESGFLIGFITAYMVVTSADKARQPRLKQPGDREWVTLIQAVNATGWALPAYLVVQGRNHLANWYQDQNIPGDWVIATTSNGWTTNETTAVWIRHFDRHTKARISGQYRLLILDGHESHHSAEFKLYCTENRIITLCMPPHSSHILQPLDVGCFSPLKRLYGQEILRLVRARITHITKADFLPAFQAVFSRAFSEKNIKAGFRVTGLVPYDPEYVIQQLPVKLRTPTPPVPSLAELLPWQSQTPKTGNEVTLQADLIKNRVRALESSSPRSILSGINHLAKATGQVMHQMVIIQKEIIELRRANELLSKRRRAKRTRLQDGGELSFQDAQVLRVEKDVVDEQQEEVAESSHQQKRAKTGPRRCGQCGDTGHNVRTCQTI